MPHLGMIAITQHDHSFALGTIEPDYGDEPGQAACMKIYLTALEVLLKPAEPVTAPIGFCQLNGRIKIVGSRELLRFEHLRQAFVRH